MAKEGKLSNFQKLRSIVLGMIGKEDFDKDASGKAILSQDDKNKLGGAFSADFISKFEQALDLSAELVEQQASSQAAIDQLRNDNATKMQEMTQKVNAETERANQLAAENAQLKRDKESLQQAVDALSDEPDGGKAAERIITVGVGPQQPKGNEGREAIWGKLDGAKRAVIGKYFHNQMAAEYLEGNTGKAMGASNSSFGRSDVPGMSGNTINVDELYNEFGTYLSQSNIRLEIIQILTQKTESQNYMTTKQAITEWRASKDAITSVVQQYVAKWTPLGSAKFTPITIKNRHHKVNMPITPDDINDSWLSFLYDEQVTPEQMPVTRYVIEKLLRPKIDADIELLMIATGVYEELGSVTEGQAGQETGKNMDGYVTVLKLEKATGTSKVNFFDPSEVVSGWNGVITKENIVDVLEGYADFVEDVAPLYAKAGMNIFIDPKLHKWYKRRYRDQYPTTKNQDKNDDAPDFSNLTFVPLDAMRGTGTFFSTPKENFIRLIHKNAAGGETKIWLQTQDYTVKVFAEFWLGTGFALAELVFAYVPETETSGSGA